MLGSDQLAEDDVRVVLCDGVIVCDFLDHMDVVFLVVVPELGFEHHEEIVALLSLQGDALSIGGHLAVLDVDLPLDVACAIVEEQHVGARFSPE